MERIIFKGPSVIHRAEVGTIHPDTDSSDIVAASFSSETREVHQDDDVLGHVPEILGHSVAGVNLSPLLNVGSILRNHDRNQIVGHPVHAHIDEATGRGHVRIRFGKTQAALNAAQEVKDGLMRGVSVGFTPRETFRIHPGESFSHAGRIHHGPAIFHSRWDVHEISLTPMPADSTVGLGRSLRSSPTVSPDLGALLKFWKRSKDRELLRQVQAFSERSEILVRYRIPERLWSAFEPSLSAPEVFRLAMAIAPEKPSGYRFEAILCDESPFKGSDGKEDFVDCENFRVIKNCPVLWRHSTVTPCGQVLESWFDAARRQIRGIIDLSTPLGMHCNFDARNALWEAIRGEVGLSPLLNGERICRMLFTSGTIDEVSLTANPQNKRLGIVRQV